MEQAESAYLEILEIDPKNAAALNELAFFAYGQGDLPRSRELLHRALEVDPQNENARANLSRIEEISPGGEVKANGD